MRFLNLLLARLELVIFSK